MANLIPSAIRSPGPGGRKTVSVDIILWKITYAISGIVLSREDNVSSQPQNLSVTMTNVTGSLCNWVQRNVILFYESLLLYHVLLDLRIPVK